jgi:hypothetical protein
MMLPLQRTPEREQALQQFISEIHDPTSPHFHHWIAAAEFGQRYGVTPADVARVTDWLESRGFKVNLVYRNQMVIDFTGSAGQIRQAFHTEIHHLLVNGQAHIANMSDAQISAALTSTVAACPIQIAYVRLPLGYRAWARKCKNEPQTTEHRESRGGEH